MAVKALTGKRCASFTRFILLRFLNTHHFDELKIFATQPPPVPTRRGARLHFNALTWIPIPYEKQMVAPVERVDTEGYCILPPEKYKKPTLGDLLVDKIKEVLHGSPYFHDREIIALLELRTVKPEYLAPVQVVCLHQKTDQVQRLAIFRRNVYALWLPEPDTTSIASHLARNARPSTAEPMTLTLHGLPVPFARFYGFPLLDAA